MSGLPQRTSSGLARSPAIAGGSGGRPDRHKHSVHRTPLGHTSPAWVAAGSLFFVTICCEERGSVRLTTPDAARIVLGAAENYHQRGRWFLRLFLLMPDHLHALIAFPAHEKMNEVIRNWKAFTRRQAGVVWQRNFFDHRLRSDESWEHKAAYIRMNPVRRNLVSLPTQWPFVIEH
jgi:REP element-mobilizing transposase RayT